MSVIAWRTVGSSSTTMTLSGRPAGRNPPRRSSAGWPVSLGSSIDSRAPPDSRFWIHIRPPIPFTRPNEIANPRPVPCSPLVVKNGSNTRSRISGGTPGPSSSMVSITNWSARRAAMTKRPDCLVLSIACSELTTALRTTCCSSCGSPITVGTSSAMRTWVLMRARFNALRCRDSTRSTTSCGSTAWRVRGRCRAKSSSVCTIRPARIASA